jgi:ATP-binding cassette subfamily B protein
MRAARIRSRFLPAIDLLPSLGLVAVLGLGGHRVINGEMSLGGLVAFNTYLTMLIWPMRNIGMTVAFAQRAASALLRVNEILSEVPAIADAVEPRQLPQAGLAQPVGAVSFNTVVFGYDIGHPDLTVLNGLSLTIAPGESVAIVGATGSGKSTITRLLLRFYDPQSGSIELDGVDLRSLTLSDLRRAVGVVFEDTLLFNDTVSANIAFAKPEIEQEIVVRAAQLAGAHDFIMQLPQQYDTVLGERGFSLSGGQRQRIAIARAIVADSRVLVLDDATSAVDPTKEHEIRDALATVMRGRTTLVIAHRPATIELADRAVLLDNGVIAAVGTHQELLATNEKYREVLAAWSTPQVVE